MLQKVIKGFQDTKLALLSKVMDSSAIADEDGFLDDGFIKARIQSLKEEHHAIQEEINILTSLNDQRNHEKMIQYRLRQEDLIFQIAFYASNSLNMIDDCLSFLENRQIDFLLCLQALKAYKEERHLEAFQLFYRYFEDKSGLLEHYLINKVYGILLLNEKQYDQAKLLLQKAIEKRPDDIELHRLLRDLYQQLGLEIEYEIETMILQQFGVTT